MAKKQQFSSKLADTVSTQKAFQSYFSVIHVTCVKIQAYYDKGTGHPPGIQLELTCFQTSDSILTTQVQWQVQGGRPYEHDLHSSLCAPAILVQGLGEGEDR